LKKPLAIIGSGISGLSAAYFLKHQFDVTLFEKNDRLGGHSRTISITNPKNQKIDVDTGFIVLNDRNYPNLNKLFKHLKVEIVKTDMTFSVSVNQGALEWSGTSIDGFFAQRKNLLNLHMLKGIVDIFTFNKKALKCLEEFPQQTLGQFVDSLGLGTWFRDYYILPMGGAIWSCPYSKILEFPAITFINFFNNHGLLTINDRPQWYTLKNKSRSYVQAIEQAISPHVKIVKSAIIDCISRTDHGVDVAVRGQNTKNFDEVIFSCHPTEILKFLKDPSPLERKTLSKFSNQKNVVYTHRDENLMPKRRKCWSSWNYLLNKNDHNQDVCVTYWMNGLQHIDKSSPVFVSLNPNITIDEDKIYDICEFSHPVFDRSAIDAQEEIHKIQGSNKLWFCGAYLKYGFHEDGISSAINVVSTMGKDLLW
jgi:predicted NAD/FAD-binding protein